MKTFSCPKQLKSRIFRNEGNRRRETTTHLDGVLTMGAKTLFDVFVRRDKIFPVSEAIQMNLNPE